MDFRTARKCVAARPAAGVARSRLARERRVLARVRARGSGRRALVAPAVRACQPSLVRETGDGLHVRSNMPLSLSRRGNFECIADGVAGKGVEGWARISRSA